MANYFCSTYHHCIMSYETKEEKIGIASLFNMILLNDGVLKNNLNDRQSKGPVIHQME